MRTTALLLFSVALAAHLPSAFGQDDPFAHEDPFAREDLLVADSSLDRARRAPRRPLDVGGRGNRILPPTTEVGVGDAPELPDLGLALTLPRYSWLPARRAALVDQVTLTRLPPGSLLLRYQGFQGFVVGKLRRELRKRWLSSLRDQWEGQVLSDDAYEQALEAMYDDLALHEAGGAYWTRRWYESLPAEKGGAPEVPYVQQVGQKVDLVRIGSWSISNDMRAHLDGVTLSLDAGQGPYVRRSDGSVAVRLAREHARLARARGETDSEIEAGVVFDDATDPNPPSDDEGADATSGFVRLTFTAPRPTRWLGGTEIKVKLRPTARFKLDQADTYFVRDLSLRAQFTFCDPTTVEGRRFPLPLACLEAVLRYQPENNELSCGVELALIAW
jgi:hypothetical protein